MMRATLHEVASRAGVAISSVSRVLTGHPDVSPEMRARVLEAAAALGYKPNMIAQSIRTNSTRTVGFIVGDISNPLLAEIALGAERTLAAAGYSMILTNSENDPARDAEHVELFDQRRVDGLLLSLASERHKPTLRALRSIGVPLVVLDRHLPKSLAASAVQSDHAAGIGPAVDALVELGHRRIAMIVGQPMRPSNERQRAFNDSMQRHHLSATAIVIDGSMTEAHGDAAITTLLTAEHPPTAVIVGGNQLLVGVARAARRMQVSIGSDLSVVSCDDIPLAELHQPPISVVWRDPVEMGQVAAALLLERMTGESAAREQVLPTRFLSRGSIAAPNATPTSLTP